MGSGSQWSGLWENIQAGFQEGAGSGHQTWHVYSFFSIPKGRHVCPKHFFSSRRMWAILSGFSILGILSARTPGRAMERLQERLVLRQSVSSAPDFHQKESAWGWVWASSEAGQGLYYPKAKTPSSESGAPAWQFHLLLLCSLWSHLHSCCFHHHQGVRSEQKNLIFSSVVSPVKRMNWERNRNKNIPWK